MKLKPLPALIAASVLWTFPGQANEPEKAAEAPATIPAKSLTPAASVKQIRTRLLGKWTVSAEATKALPADTANYPWIPEKLDEVFKAGLAWEFRQDGTVVMTYEGGSETEGYRFFQDKAGAVWVAISRRDDWSLQRASFEGGHLHLTPVARDKNEKEIPILGTLVLSRSP